jgi:pilus assembly protein CpaC
MKSWLLLLSTILCTQIAPMISPIFLADARADDEDPALESKTGDVKYEGSPQLETTPAENAHRRRPKATDGKFQKSKLTSDRSELEADHRVLVLAAGIDKIVDLDPSIQFSDMKKEIQPGNFAVLSILPVTIGKHSQIIFKPQAEGETNVTVRDKSGKVRLIFDVYVAKQNVVRYLERLRDKLKEVEGITINIEDQKIIIRGEVLSPNDYGLIVNELAEKSYSDAVINKATMSMITLNALAKKIESDIQVFAPTVHTSILNAKIILEGTVESEGLKQRAMKRAEWYLPMVRVSEPIAGASNIEKNDRPLQIIQSDIQVTPPQPKRESKLVRLTVYFVELSKDFLKMYGFKWQPGFTVDPTISIGTTPDGGTGTSGAGGFTFAGSLSSLIPMLNAPPSSASYGRILKSANVIVKSETGALVKDVQVIPTENMGPNGTTIAGPPIEVGLEARITPTILQNQDIDLDVKLENSNQVGRGVGGSPIKATHKIETRLYVKSGEVAGVAGINNQDSTTGFNRDDANPGSFSSAQGGGAQTKPLFTLSRSKSMSKKKGQFVVFISPQIIESASEGSEDLKKNFRMKSQ